MTECATCIHDTVCDLLQRNGQRKPCDIFHDGCELYEPKLVSCCDCEYQVKKWHSDGRMKAGGYVVYSCGRNEDPFVGHTVNGYDDEFCSHGIARYGGDGNADHCV